MRREVKREGQWRVCTTVQIVAVNQPFDDLLSSVCSYFRIEHHEIFIRVVAISVFSIYFLNILLKKRRKDGKITKTFLKSSLQRRIENKLNSVKT